MLCWGIDLSPPCCEDGVGQPWRGGPWGSWVPLTHMSVSSSCLVSRLNPFSWLLPPSPCWRATRPPPVLCLRHSGPAPWLGRQVGLPPLPFECFSTSSPLLPRVTPSGVLGLRRRRGASVSALLGSLPLPPGLCWVHQEHPPLCVSVCPPALSSVTLQLCLRKKKQTEAFVVGALVLRRDPGPQGPPSLAFF